MERNLEYDVIGAAMEVHRLLGSGFVEAVYQEALAIELSERGIPFQREVTFGVTYKGHRLSKSYRPDFLCDGCLIVELKAIREIGDLERAQLLGYLHSTGLRKGILINFGGKSLQHQSFIV